MADTIRAFIHSPIEIGQPVKTNCDGGTVGLCEFDGPRFIGITTESATDGVVTVLTRGWWPGIGIPPTPDIPCLEKDARQP